MVKDVKKKTPKKNNYLEDGAFDLSDIRKHQEEKNRKKTHFESKKNNNKQEDKWK